MERSTDFFRLKSVLTGASRIAEAMGQALPGTVYERGLTWDSDFLVYSVREPFPSVYTGTELTFGRVSQSNKLEIVSNMPVDGIIFSDGVEQDYLEFNTGRIAKIGVAERNGRLVV
jgi:hypothetical protein